MKDNTVKVGFYVSEGAIPNECEIKKCKFMLILL